MKSILDRSFIYTNSAETDLAKKFRAIKRQLKDQQKLQAANEAERKEKLRPIKKAG